MVPGKIEAEEFDLGGDGYAYYDLDSENRNGGDREEGVDMSNTAIGYTQKGEWLEYTIEVEQDGKYTMSASVASGADGSSFKLYIDNEAVTDVIEVPNTGDWETFVTVDSEIDLLTVGKHILKLEITGDWLDMDYMQFSLISEETGVKVPLADFFVGGDDCTVYSLLGQQIKTIKCRDDLRRLPSGVYLLKSNAYGCRSPRP